MARRANNLAAHSGKSVKPSTSTPGQHATKEDPDQHAVNIPLELQQKCLDIFRDALEPTADDNKTLQEVKGHLYNRDFATAFGKEDYLRVYASRWSPSRALAYIQVMRDACGFLKGDEDVNENRELRVLCLGGGAGGEHVGLAAWMSSNSCDTSSDSPRGLRLDLIDMADWSQVILALHKGITTPPELSKYASQAKKDTNRALLEAKDLTVSFHQTDVLGKRKVDRKFLMGTIGNANLVTFMFTLNELYSTSLPQTQDLLTRIKVSVQLGCLLLVVDSPGSYSTVSINGAEKNYPMQWLLDYTLLGPPGKPKDDRTEARWEKLVDDSSRWFRLPKSLQYPIELEDMRYQIHLYRRLSGSEG